MHCQEASSNVIGADLNVLKYAYHRSRWWQSIHCVSRSRWFHAAGSVKPDQRHS